MVTTRAFALRDAGECYACQMLFEGDGSDAVPHSCFCTQKDLHRGLKLSLGAGLFTQLRQQESNLRWGSQSPLPYRLAMAHQ